MVTPIGRIFISHSSQDKPFVDRVVGDLTARAIPVWYDKFDIAIGDSVPGKVNEGLSTAKYFLIVLSEASVASRWVQEELNAALVKQIAQGGTFLLPILYKDCVIPPLLKHRRYADFRSDYGCGLNELLSVWGMDAQASLEVGGKSLYPWPNVDRTDQEFIYLHSKRFDKFFRMNCSLSANAREVIKDVVETLKLPWNKDVPELGMRWSFDYGLMHKGKSISLSTTLRDAGLIEASVVLISISGTYEDIWENELSGMWDGTKLYEMGGALQYAAKLKESIRRRGTLTSDRLHEMANACFSHV